ncbi:MAG: DUF4159 domain-containing protein [Planctomycetes bacterium]|nr:DUF4159 domain-containing protein [Planctomycetota bacterium]
MMKRLLPLLLAAGALAAASENDWFVPLGPPPKAAPRHISGGESFPPLPLPATPLRRSERKKDPAPPKLIGKVVWGETASLEVDGNATELADWNLCPADLQSLLRMSGQALSVRYGAQTVTLAGYDPDPSAVPLLFISGTRRLRMDADQLATLRLHVQRGGMLVFDSVAGSPWFTESVRETLAKLFPDRPLRRIPADHPIYHAAVDVAKAGFGRNPPGDQAALEGVYIGSRIGVLLSPYGLGCGWDGRPVPMLKQAVFFDVETAGRIGVNLVAYALGYAQAGLEEAKPELFGAADAAPPSDELVFTQLTHEGHWDVHPGAAAALLRRSAGTLAVRVSLRRQALNPDKDPLTGRTFAWLTGLDDARLSDNAIANLRRFLDAGGTLVVNNGLGLATFDAAARRELARLLPGQALKPIPADHPMLAAGPFPVGQAQLTPAARAAEPELKTPALEGIAINGDIRVIYSRLDLEAGWTGCEFPMMKGYEGDTATALGLNLIVYAATH